MKYPGKVISSTRPTSNTSLASGIWNTQDQMQGMFTSSWPGAPGAAASGITAPILIPGVVSSSGTPAYAPSQSDYTTAGMSYPSGVNYSFSSGYHYFTLPAGSFNVNIRGAEGSGTQHGYGANINATLVTTGSVRLVALVGTRGGGSYSGAGGTFLAITPGSDTYSGATALLVAGGGGGGYSNLGTYSDAGGTSWTSTSRRSNNTDCGTYGGGSYDAGAGFGASFHSISVYSCTLSGSGSYGSGPQAFDSGGQGGQVTACAGGASLGGFGGGGGSCPGGGGGYYGGYAGGNSPSQTGGGGGTSYRLSSGTTYISTWSDGATWSSGNRSASNSTCYNGYLSISNA